MDAGSVLSPGKSGPGFRKKADLLGVVALLLLGLEVRVRHLGGADLWGDEAVSWFVGSVRLSELLSRIAAFEVKPPLYFLGLHFWMRAFGDTEASMRAFSALFWPPFALLVFDLGRRLCGRWALLPLFL